MLRRIANHLFWVARYLERAEWRARLVDVNYHLLVESPLAGTTGWSSVLGVTGDRAAFAERYTACDEQSVLNFYSFDQDNPSSIRSCVALARENCRALRNRISSELWIAINGLYLDSRLWTPESLAAHGVYGFFAELRDRFYRISGIVSGTMPRDLGYEFLTAGRMLEAVENVTRLLDAKYHFLLPSVEDVGSPLDLAQWAALLRSASALEAYRKTYGNAVQIARVVEFLLFDPNFPRAARFCIDRLENAIERIGSPAAQPTDAPPVPTARALSMHLRAGSSQQAIDAGLHEYLLDIQEQCARISDEIFAEYLRFE